MWINCSDKKKDLIFPEYIEDAIHSRDVIIVASIGDKYIVHCGYYTFGQWYNMSGTEINVIKWMDFPSP